MIITFSFDNLYHYDIMTKNKFSRVPINDNLLEVINKDKYL